MHICYFILLLLSYCLENLCLDISSAICSGAVGYGNDNPGAKSQGMKQLMAGGGVALIGTTLVPLLSGLFG